MNRQHLTVIFCQSVHDMQIAAQVNPEEWRKIAVEFWRDCSEVVRNYGGSDFTYLGDGIIAHFGWPQVCENDAESALRAGFAILEAVGAFNRHSKPANLPLLTVRIGIDATTVDENNQGERQVFDRIRTRAARVNAEAAPDSIVMTSSVYSLVSSLFAVEKCGAIRFKGASKPVDLYRALRPLSDQQNDIHEAISSTIPSANEWLKIPNSNFGGSEPGQFIGTPLEYRIWDLLGAIRQGFVT